MIVLKNVSLSDMDLQTLTDSWKRKQEARYRKRCKFDDALLGFVISGTRLNHYTSLMMMIRRRRRMTRRKKQTLLRENVKDANVKKPALKKPKKVQPALRRCQEVGKGKEKSPRKMNQF
jgi:hypothetical protein